MASEIPNTYKLTYEDNMRLALQQQSSVLWDACPETAGEGEKKKLDDIVGNVKGQKRTTRGAPTPITDGSHSRVWVAAPDPDENAFIVETMDQLQSGIQLESGYVMANAGMIARAKNDAFLKGFYGSMIVGKTGTSTSSFSNSMVVPVATGAAAATRHNIEKLRAARKLLVKNFNPPAGEEWYHVVTAEQVDDFMGQLHAIHADFAKTFMPKWSEDGKRLLGLCGFTFLEDELSNTLYDNAGLTVDGSGYRKNPFWTKSGMRRVPWENMYTSLSIRNDLGDAKQIYARCQVATTRTDNLKCGYILNLET